MHTSIHTSIQVEGVDYDDDPPPERLSDVPPLGNAKIQVSNYGLGRVWLGRALAYTWVCQACACHSRA